MSCSPIDLRDYFLRELTDGERRQTEIHLKGCPECREELERLRLTEAALLSLRDEEIPQRIGFVSDRVFEPSPLRRWWQAFWGSAARLGFASAAMLSVAVLVSALSRPAPAPQAGGGMLARSEITRLETEFTNRLGQAVADAEARQAKKTAELLAAVEQRQETQRRMLLLEVGENWDYLQKKVNVARYSAANQAGGADR